MKTVCGILILLLCTSAVRSDYVGLKMYYSSTECKGQVVLQAVQPLNNCYKSGTTGSQKYTFADKKFTQSVYTTTDCTGTATSTTAIDTNKCSPVGTNSMESVVLTDADIAKAKAGGVFRRSYSASNKCESPSDTYPSEILYDASWKDTCVSTSDTASVTVTWTTKVFTIKNYAVKDCSGETTTTEYNLGECKNTSSTSSEMYLQDTESPASPLSSAFHAIMFVFVVTITLVQ